VADIGNATSRCVDRYLTRVLDVSPARLVIVYGDLARNAVRAHLEYDDPGVFPSRPIEVGRVERRIAFLTHPRAPLRDRPKVLPPTELEDAQAWLFNTR
jgi:hypothetical protein